LVKLKLDVFILGSVLYGEKLDLIGANDAPLFLLFFFLVLT
jgi:hypothetical protein